MCPVKTQIWWRPQREPTHLGAAHFADLAGFETIQYEQTVPGRVTLKVVCERDLDDSQRSAIERAVRLKTQGGCEVEVVRVPRLEPTDRPRKGFRTPLKPDKKGKK